MWVRWNSWNHFGCGINEDLIKQTGTPAPPAHSISSSPSSSFSPSRACSPSFFLSTKQKLYICFKKNEDYKNLLRVHGKKKEVAETFACFREREKKKRSYPRGRVLPYPHPFQLLGWRLLVWQIRSVRRSHVSTLLVWVACTTHQQIPATRALCTREDFVRSRSALNLPFSERTTSHSKFVCLELV